MFGQKVTDLSDQTIANNILAGKAAASTAYLKSTLKTATPELKQLFSTNLTQVVGEHTALSQLVANKEWEDPYEQPEKQLLETIDQSKKILENQVTE